MLPQSLNVTMDDHSRNRVKLLFAVAIFPSRRPHVQESGFRNQGNFRLWNRESGKIRLAVSESWALKSGIQLKESVIPLTIGICNPSVTDKEPGLQLLEPEIYGVESRIQDCIHLDFFTYQVDFSVVIFQFCDWCLFGKGTLYYQSLQAFQTTWQGTLEIACFVSTLVIGTQCNSNFILPIWTPF